MTALETLGLAEGASVAEIKTAFRRLVSTAHPDHGGSPEAFDKLRQAYNKALAEAEAREGTCPTCQGTKRVSKQSGWSQLWLPCPTCSLYSED